MPNNIDFDHSDLDHSLPLGQEWERLAMKDLSEIAQFLTHGLFINKQDYCDRLRDSADAIDPKESIGYAQDDTGAEIPYEIVLAVLGVNINAVSYAAKRMGIPMETLFWEGKKMLKEQRPEDLEAIVKEVTSKLTA